MCSCTGVDLNPPKKLYIYKCMYVCTYIYIYGEKRDIYRDFLDVEADEINERKKRKKKRTAGRFL